MLSASLSNRLSLHSDHPYNLSISHDEQPLWSRDHRTAQAALDSLSPGITVDCYIVPKGHIFKPAYSFSRKR